jgi:hypothetical protein
MRTLISKGRWLVAAAAIAFLTGALPAKESAGDPTLAEGISKVEEGDYEGGLAPLEKAVARIGGQEPLRKEEARVRLYLGVAYAALSRDEDARREFRAVFVLDRRIAIPLERFPPRATRLLVEEASGHGRVLYPASPRSGKGGPRMGPLLLAGSGLGAAAALKLAGTDDPLPTPTPAVAPDDYFETLSASPPAAVMAVSSVVFVAEAQDCGSPSWTWDFGDGSSATTAAPAHVYEQAGDFQASVTARCQGGATVRGFLQVPVRSFTGTWFGNMNLDGSYGVFRLTQTGATFVGDCAPCYGAWVGPISGSIAAQPTSGLVDLTWHQGTVDAAATVWPPFVVFSLTSPTRSLSMARGR